MWKGRKIDEVREYKYLCSAGEWRTGEAGGRKGEKGSGSYGQGVGNREKEVWKRLKKERMDD